MSPYFMYVYNLPIATTAPSMSPYLCQYVYNLPIAAIAPSMSPLLRVSNGQLASC